MRYMEVTKEQLESARPGLSLIEMVQDEPIELYLYGLTNDKVTLMHAREALQEQFDEEEEAEERNRVPELTVVAIAIELSSDTLHYLTGGGLILRREEFAYTTHGEGARTQSFDDQGIRPRLSLNDFTQLAVSDSDSWLDDFLTEHAPKVEVLPPVRRTQPATSPAAPKTPPPTINPIDSYLNT